MPPRFFIVALFFLLFTTPLLAQELHEDLQGVWSARVVEVVSEREAMVPGTQTPTTVQTIQAEILEGEQRGQLVELTNDYYRLKVGQKFFLNYLIDVDGSTLYSVRDVDRRSSLVVISLIFIGVVIAFGGKQGVRALLSLIGSFAAILFILLPLLIRGYSPVLVSILVGTVVLFSAIFFTHGFNKQSIVAFIGTVSGVVFTGILATLAVKGVSLSGFSSEDTVYLNFRTDGLLDFRGLLLGGIIIGVLGVLDDIAVTQVAVVAEIKKAASHLNHKEIFERSIRVGREHVSALVNTLVLAYAGVSLPLLLLFAQSDAALSTIINQELFATEIVRTIVGSIGLILTVPLTTLLAVYLLKDKDLDHIHGHHH